MARVLRMVTGTLLAVGLAATAAPPASAEISAAPAAGKGRTDVVVAPDVYDLLEAAGIEAKATGGATAVPFRGTVKIKFPITGVKSGGDKITHSGGLKLSAGRTSLSASELTVVLDPGTVSADTKGSEIGSVGRVDLFTIAATDDPELGAVSLLLTATAADAFNATFGDGVVAAGDLFGYATPRPKA